MKSALNDQTPNNIYIAIRIKLGIKVSFTICTARSLLTVPYHELLEKHKRLGGDMVA